MPIVVASILAALSSAGILGFGDQYAVLFVAGVCTRMGLIQPVGQASFIAEPWFLAVVAAAWLITNLPALVPHNSFVASLVNAISGWLSLVSGGIFALVSAGVIVHVRPELATSLYLLSHDARWTDLGSYHMADVALLTGGAMVGSTFTLAKFVAKPGIALKTGTFGHLAGPMFAVTETGGALVLTPIVLELQRSHPLVLLAFMLCLAAGLAVILVFSIRFLMAEGHGLGRFLVFLDDHPREGMTVLAEFLVPGTGWLVVGRPLRGMVMLGIWGILLFLAVSVIGLIIAVPAYLVIARSSAVSLYQYVTQQLPPEPSPAASGNRMQEEPPLPALPPSISPG